MIISTSKYIKTNGDTPILPPLQMMSETGVVAGGLGDTGAKGGLATPESNTWVPTALLSLALPAGPVTEIPGPIGSRPQERRAVT